MSANPEQQQLLALAEKLLESTRAGKTSWSGDSSLTAFTFATPGRGSVTIYSTDGDGVFPFEFLLSNPEGVAIESVRSGSRLADPLTNAREGYPWNELLEELYREARRSAINLDSVIQGISDAIDNPPSSPSDDDIPF